MSSFNAAPSINLPACTVLLPLRIFAKSTSVRPSVSASLRIPCATSMGLLEKLWDDTVAGPQPDNGLKRLRRYNTFGAGSRATHAKESGGGANERSYGEDSQGETMKVTRSIMIVKASGNRTAGSGSPPTSPAGSTPPVSPFSGGGRDAYRFRRKSTADAEAAGEAGPGIPSPPEGV